jgi:uncharacterized membrane protein YbaN (DUF454 family)
MLRLNGTIVMMRILLLTCGWLFVALAIAGAMLPLLPATPFVLLAAACFTRSSPRAMRWLADSRLLGPVYRDWQLRGGMRRSTKTALASAAICTPVFTFALFPGPEIPVIASSLGATVALVALALVPTVR